MDRTFCEACAEETAVASLTRVVTDRGHMLLCPLCALTTRDFNRHRELTQAGATCPCCVSAYTRERAAILAEAQAVARRAAGM